MDMNQFLTEKDMAGDLLKDININVTGYANAVLESSEPYFRNNFKDFMNQTLNAQEQLFQYMKQQGMYKVPRILDETMGANPASGGTMSPTMGMQSSSQMGTQINTSTNPQVSQVSSGIQTGYQTSQSLNTNTNPKSSDLNAGLQGSNVNVSIHTDTNPQSSDLQSGLQSGQNFGRNLNTSTNPKVSDPKDSTKKDMKRR